MAFSPENYDDLPDIETLCAHWGEDRTRYLGAVIPPIFQNSLFTTPDIETRYLNRADDQFDYTRVSNPTTDITEAKIAVLEGGEQARCFGSGMAAISAAIFSCVKAGDHVVAVSSIYGPTRQFLSDYLPRFNISVTYVEGCDPQEFADAVQSNTILFYLESPSSLVMKQQDLAAVAQIAQKHGIVTICDNSWASPVFQNPLKMGIDLVVHSATKYLGGHSDIVAGVVIGKADRMKRLVQNEGQLFGGVLDPFASWLLMRGLRTLPIRMERHQRTTTHIANALLEHPKVTEVFYPGIRTDPQGELTCRQLRGTSGLISFVLKAQTQEDSFRFVNTLRYFGLGCSWGGFESLALPMLLGNVHLPTKDGSKRWIIRLHIGLESEKDLWDDLEAAFAVV